MLITVLRVVSHHVCQLLLLALNCSLCYIREDQFDCYLIYQTSVSVVLYMWSTGNPLVSDSEL